MKGKLAVVPDRKKQNIAKPARERVVIMGAAGRDIHTLMDLARLIALAKPHCRVSYDLAEIGHPDLAEIVVRFVHTQADRLPRN